MEVMNLRKEINESITLTQERKLYQSKRPHNCRQSGKAYSQKSHLIKCHKIQTWEKPYECHHVGNVFLFKNNTHFIVHQRIHTARSPCGCNQHGEIFRYNSSLITHHHGFHTEKKPYECTEYGESCFGNTHLIAHQG